MLTAIVITVACAVLGFIPLLGLPGAGLLVASMPLINLVHGPYAGQAMMRHLGDAAWPFAIVLTLLWPIAIVPSYLATRALAGGANPYGWPWIAAFIGIALAGGLLIVFVAVLISGRAHRLDDGERLVEAASAGDARTIARLATSEVAGTRAGKALMEAIEAKRQHAVAALLEHVPAARSRAAADGWPLTRACQFGQSRSIAALLAAGAKPSWTDAHGERNDVAFAVGHPDGDASEIALLAKAGAGFTTRDANGRTPLMTCLSTAPDQRGDLVYARALLDLGVDVHAADDRGNTALHYAYAGRSRDVIALLLERGAEASRRNAEGKTPAEMPWSLPELQAHRVPRREAPEMGTGAP